MHYRLTLWGAVCIIVSGLNFGVGIWGGSRLSILIGIICAVAAVMDGIKE